VIGPDGAKSLAGVLSQCKSLVQLNLSFNDIGSDGAKALQECYHSVQYLLLRLDLMVLKALQECYHSANHWLI